ncbi:hypothetical protein [uncultured Dysosmobacter sp.]|uniref:hypothetical protein n=1 Tax=uncultured Dysosmobacter sp. TaxID=2591384 RepID=UPI0026171BAB|nr:hypothetical protein [uncultured Dysosmobacter sp.]
MKHFKRIFSYGIIAVCILSSFLCTFALARSSAYLDGYSATITPLRGGEIAVTVDVAGVGSMDEIGASKIYIYESTDGKNFTRVATYKSDDYPEMLKSKTTTYYDSPVVHSGEVGYYYYADVYCYAAKDGGSDTKLYSTSVKRAIR